MKWITRERPKIDRIACPWLVARFIDEAPEFLYVPAGDVMRIASETGATPYDVPGVELGHHGEQCSFDAFIEKYQIKDKVELVMEEGYILIKPINKPRQHWDEAFEEMHQNGDDQLLIDSVFMDENVE